MYMVSPTLYQIHAHCQRQDRAFWPTLLSKASLDNEPLLEPDATELLAADFDALGVVVG